MNRRDFFLCGAGLQAAARGQTPKPNVVFLFTDDQRADTIGALGNPHIQTPHLDELARSGMVFRNAYCMGGNSAAVCLPSRNMLLSGRSFFRYDRFASGSDPNFADSMKELGYETYHHGKRGNTAIEIQKRFDHDKYVDDMPDRNSGEPGKQIVDDAIAFVTKRRKDRPFFAYLAFGNPHDPRVASQRYLDRYDRAKIPLPKNYLPVHSFDNGEMVVRDELLAPWPRTVEEIRRQTHEYYAVISGLDENIGRLTGALKDSGQFDNTIILFSSDQGIALGSHGLMGKQNLYQPSMNAPLFLRGPGIRPGQTEAMVYLLDIYPAIVDLLGGTTPPGLDGRSFAGVVRGRARVHRDSIFLAYRDCQRAIHDGRWKMIAYPRINRRQLFDLAQDPHETRDRSGEPAQRERMERMAAALRRAQTTFGDLLALETSQPARAEWTPPEGAELDAIRKRWRM